MTTRAGRCCAISASRSGRTERTEEEKPWPRQRSESNRLVSQSSGYAHTRVAKDAAGPRRSIASSACAASAYASWRTRANCPVSRNRRGDRRCLIRPSLLPRSGQAAGLDRVALGRRRKVGPDVAAQPGRMRAPQLPTPTTPSKTGPSKTGPSKTGPSKTGPSKRNRSERKPLRESRNPNS